MPELPEVEVLIRHLAPLLVGRTIRSVGVSRPKVVRPAALRDFERALVGARFEAMARRAKYLVFTLRPRGRGKPFVLAGHLGMTGRMYLAAESTPLPKHAAVVLGLGRQSFIFEDTRYFGRLTLDTRSLEGLGPEPLGKEFTPEVLSAALRRSSQPIKVKLLDQTVVAGVGNIYASEALHRARISPTLPARRLSAAQVRRLWRAIRAVLREAIACGSTVPLSYDGRGKRDGLFYFGRAADAEDYYEERLRVYDRKGEPCGKCGTPIQRLVQAARSTFYCPECQGR